MKFYSKNLILIFSILHDFFLFFYFLLLTSIFKTKYAKLTQRLSGTRYREHYKNVDFSIDVYLILFYFLHIYGDSNLKQICQMDLEIISNLFLFIFLNQKL